MPSSVIGPGLGATILTISGWPGRVDGARAMPSRWATFDCYGTLIDWGRGACEGPARCGPRRPGPAAWPSPPRRAPRAGAAATRLPRGPRRCLGAVARSRASRCPTAAVTPWRSLAAVPRGAGSARRAASRAGGWRSSRTPTRTCSPPRWRRSGCPSTLLITAAEAGSYKPAPGHWERFFADSGGRSRPPRARRREPLPRHRARARMGLTAVGSTAWASRASSPGRPSCPIWRACRDLVELACRLGATCRSPREHGPRASSGSSTTRSPTPLRISRTSQSSDP